MEVKLAQCVNKGMQRDYSMDKASQEFAYENHNIRITTTGNESFLSVTNEKSTVELHSSNIICVITNKYSGGEYNELQITHNIPDNKEVILKITTENPDEGVEQIEYFTINNKNKVIDNYYTYNTILKVESEDEDYNIIIDRINQEQYAHGFTTYIRGVVLGNALIGDALVVFSKNYDTDYIYKCIINNNSNTYSLQILYEGDLKFNINNPIECITSYDSDEIQKVYWVDGINQPRYINICKTYTENTNFDFVPSISSNINVSVEKEYNGVGNFTSGVIQYFITCYNKYEAESNTIYESPLYYISPRDRGGKVNEAQTCSFKLLITPKDNKYKHLRVYSIIRTSLNSQIDAKLVQDIEINNHGDTIEITDSNNGIPIAPTDILFLGGNTIIAKTIEQKDGTLFLGNVTEVKNSIDFTKLKDVINSLKISDRKYTNKEDEKHLSENILKFKWKVVGCDDSEIGFQYNYYNQLNHNSREIKYFKYNEIYRFGVQFQTDTKEWTQTVWLDDLVCNKYPSLEQELPDENSDDHLILNEDKINDYSSFLYLPYICFDPSELISKYEYLYSDEDCPFNKFHYRLVMAESTYSDRSVVCQGYVNPTLYNTRLGHINSWNIKPINDYNKHGNNVLYLGKNSENTLVPTPMTEIDLAAYEDEKLEYNSIINQEGSADAKWQLQEIKVTHRCDYIGYAYCRIYLDFTFYNGSVTKVIETTAYGKEYGGVDKTITHGNVYRYKGYKKTKERSIYIKYEDKCFPGHATGGDGSKWSDWKDKETNFIDLFSENGITNTGLNSYILSSESDYPVVTKSESKEDTEFEKSSIVFKRISLDFLDNQKSERDNHYFINCNKCSFHTPNIDELESIVNNSDLKFRIVGKADLKKNISDYLIDAEDVSSDKGTDKQLNLKFSGNYNTDYKSYGLQSYPLWFSYGRTGKNAGYNWVYLWTAANLSKNSDTNGAKSILKHKLFGNLFYSDTINFDYNDEALETNVPILWSPPQGVKNVRTVYQDKIYIDKNTYSKNVQDVIIPVVDNYYYLENPPKQEYNAYNYIDTLKANYGEVDNIENKEEKFYFKSIDISYNSSPHIVFDLNNDINKLVVLPKYSKEFFDNYYNKNLQDVTTNYGFPIGSKVALVVQDSDAGAKDCINNFLETAGIGIYKNYYYLKDGVTLKKGDIVIYFYKEEKYWEENVVGKTFYFGTNTEPPKFKIGIYDTWTIGMVEKNAVYFIENSISNTIGDFTFNKLKSHLLTNELVFNFSYKTYKANKQQDTPIKNTYAIIGKLDPESPDETYIFECNYYRVLYETELDNLSTDNSIWIGEFYKDLNDYEPYGGTSEEAIKLNTFIPISETANLGNKCNGLEGDTYFQRWDSLRTYPNTEEDVSSIVDVVSLMIETHTNLDGRDDVTRGRSDVINIRPNNIIDTLNTVYSQSNNFITSNVLDDIFDDDTHPTLYTWTLSKQALSTVDTWTSINLNNALKLDGSKGELTKIKAWNNQLVAFQEKGIALINFNQQTTISTAEGVPVEIANSGKVTGHYYISSTQGCKNKWSIVESPYGLYFIDGYNKSINVLREDIKSLSSLNLFEDWIVNNEKGYIWNPSNYKGFKSFYDPIRKEVYFINDEYALCYNESLEQFTSFYDYQSLNIMSAINGSIYGVKNNQIHKMFEGNDYCNLFGDTKTYYMKYKINKDPFYDKVWTNIEYRADIFESGNITSNNSQKIINETFDTLKVWNEYQSGIEDLSKHAKNKFRIWRANIPRDNSSNNKRGLDRIRNPWIMLELSKSNSNKRMEFHDLLIKYLQ